MIVWVTKALILAIHDRQLAEHGGRGGLRDEGLLDVVLARPRQLLANGDPPPDLAALAASLAFGLIQHAPFVDGNTRTAQVGYRVFLALNDCRFSASEEDKYITLLSLAEGHVDEDEFAAWLRRHIALAPGHRVNEPRARYARRPPPASGAPSSTAAKDSP